MSRTKRNTIPFHGGYFRHPRVKSYLTQESKAVEELRDEGYTLNNNRLKAFKSRIPDYFWDDIYIAANHEVYNYKNKH